MTINAGVGWQIVLFSENPDARIC